MLAVSSSSSRPLSSGWSFRSPWLPLAPLRSECKLPPRPSRRSLLHCPSCTSNDGSSSGGGGGNNDGNGEGKKDSGIDHGEKEKDSPGLGGGFDLDAEVSRMLDDSESQALIQDLNAAVERVAKAKKELDALEELRMRAEIKESRQAADLTVENFQRDVFAAESDLREAEIALIKARAGDSIWGLTWEERDGMDEDAERFESVKVASVSAVIGTIAGLPFFASASMEGLELAVSAGAVLASAALFGLTYRYAIRRDLRNTQLKAGCVAAFSLVRGLGQVDASGVLLGLPELELSKVLQGALFMLESAAIFGFAAVALEYCFRQGLLRPFPLREQ